MRTPKIVLSIVFGVMAVGLLATADPSYAGRRGHGYHRGYDRPRHYSHYRHHRRHDHWPRFSLGFSYIYNDWPVWRPPVRVVAPATVVAAGPRVGTVFVSLPAGCTSFTVGSTIYYYYDDVYYNLDFAL